jgi:hypothetical protein
LQQKAQVIDVVLGTAAALRVFLAHKLPNAPAFNKPHKNHVVDMLRTDLDAARQKWIEAADTDAGRSEREESSFLAACDDAERVVDFHALQATFASLLAARDCHPKTAQEFMRHSTITLTMAPYTYTARGALGSALAKLPDLSRSDEQTAQATGTDDAVSVPARTGGRTGGNTVRNDAVSVREGATEKTRSRSPAAETTLSTRKVRELQRSEVHAEEKAATGFEPVNDGFANRSLGPLGYAAQARPPAVLSVSWAARPT